jgi:hypothetical protein
MATRIVLTVPMDTWRLLASKLKPKHLPVMSTLLDKFTPASFRRQFVDPFGPQQDFKILANEPVDTFDTFRSVHCMLAGKNPDVKLKVLLTSVFEKIFAIVQHNSLPVVEIQTPVANNPLSNKLYRVADALFPISSTKLAISCDPDVVRVNFGNFYVVRACKPIKKGALITRSIGFNYLICPFADRRLVSDKMRLTGDCECLACVEDWPQIDNLGVLKADGSKYKCLSCGYRIGRLKDFSRRYPGNTGRCPRPTCNAGFDKLKQELEGIATFVDTLQLGKVKLKRVLEMQDRARALYELPNLILVHMDLCALVCFFRDGNARPLDKNDEVKDVDGGEYYPVDTSILLFA